MQTVHFRTQADKFVWGNGPSFALKFTEHAMICLGIERVSGFEIAGVEKFDVFTHVPVDVLSLNEAAKRVGVCEEKCAIVTIFGLQVIIIELIHDQFG